MTTWHLVWDPSVSGGELLGGGETAGLVLEDEAVEHGLGDLAGVGVELSDGF